MQTPNPNFWLYLTALWREVWNTWPWWFFTLAEAALVAYGVLRSILERKKHETDPYTWLRFLSTQSLLAIGIGLLLVVVLHAGFRVYCNQSKEMTKLSSWDLPPVRGDVMDIVDQTELPGKLGNAPYGVRVVAKSPRRIEPVGGQISFTVFTNDYHADVSCDAPNGFRWVGGISGEKLDRNLAGMDRVVFQANRALEKGEEVSFTVSSSGRVKVLRIEVG